MPRSDLLAGATIPRPFAALPEASCAAVRVAVTAVGAGMVVVPIFAEDATCRDDRQGQCRNRDTCVAVTQTQRASRVVVFTAAVGQAAAEPSVVPYRFQWEPVAPGVGELCSLFGSGAY
jgi:hypothetical protein